MKILISGSSGTVGTALVTALRRDGHSVCRLVRPQSAGAGERREAAGTTLESIRWDPLGGDFDSVAAERADAVVHLAGASIAEGRWSDARKRVLRQSRVDATRHLVDALSRLSHPPRTFVSASAIGYYGNCGDEELTEQSPPGADFLAAVARDWEAEAIRAEQFGARPVMLRFGVILAASGGALKRMLLPFRLGLGGRLGSGKQWMSWLTLAEAVGVARYALDHNALRGPVNAVSPNPVRNADFTTVLGRALHRPTVFPVPAMALRLTLGEMATALLLSSQRVAPRKLENLGYSFQHPDLASALSATLEQRT